MDVREHELPAIYAWVDQLPLSRPKRNIHRDFADAVLVAEIIATYVPTAVNLHSYSACSAMNLKLYNWSTLNSKALRKLGCALTALECQECAAAKPGAIERVLKLVQQQLQAMPTVFKGQDAQALPSAGLQDDSRQGLATQPSGAWHANEAFAPGAESPRSQLEVPEKDLQSQGSGASSGAALQEDAGGDTRDAPDHMDGAESNLDAQHSTGPEGMTANILSVDLVEGALGESADFMIAAYGKDSVGSADRDTLKPTAFKASAEAQKDKDALIQDLQEKTREMEGKLSELQRENARLKRLTSLHKQRCCILEEACLKNGVHVPGGLLAYP